MKYADQHLLGQVVTVTGTPLLLNQIAQGSDANQRIGNKIITKSVQIRLTTVNSGLTTQIFRVIVFVDEQANGAVVTAAQLLENSTTGPDQIISPLNMDNRLRFKIIFDKTWSSATQTETDRVYYQRFKKVNIETQYNAATATVGAVTTGAIYMMMFNLDTTDPSTVDLHTRIRFTDN